MDLQGVEWESWTGLMWLCIGTGGGHLWIRYEPASSIQWGKRIDYTVLHLKWLVAQNTMFDVSFWVMYGRSLVKFCGPECRVCWSVENTARCIRVCDTGTDFLCVSVGYCICERDPHGQESGWFKLAFKRRKMEVHLPYAATRGMCLCRYEINHIKFALISLTCHSNPKTQ